MAYPGDAPPVVWHVRSKTRVVDRAPVTYRAYLVFDDSVAAPGSIRDDIMISWRVASATVRANEWRHIRRETEALAGVL
jgi:hypothetical protein